MLYPSTGIDRVDRKPGARRASPRAGSTRDDPVTSHYAGGLAMSTTTSRPRGKGEESDRWLDRLGQSLPPAHPGHAPAFGRARGRERA